MTYIKMVSRSGIEEANKHIQALNGRIHDLENTVKEQHNAMTAKDSFIQTKIQELMAQDRRIKELSDRLNSACEELNEQTQINRSLESSNSAKDLQILKLQKHNEKVKTLLRMIPDLNNIIEKINLVHKEVTDSNTDYYSQTPDETSGSNSAADDGNTDTFIHEENHLQNNAQMFSEVRQSVIKTQRFQKFSISEDDLDEISADSSPTEKLPEKEFYL